jgi:hypothetical protein
MSNRNGGNSARLNAELEALTPGATLSWRDRLPWPQLWRGYGEWAEVLFDKADAMTMLTRSRESWRFVANEGF